MCNTCTTDTTEKVKNITENSYSDREPITVVEQPGATV